MRRFLTTTVLLLSTTCFAEDQKASITFFREDQNAMFGGFKHYGDGDFVGGGWNFPLYVDGRKIVIIRRARFFTLLLESGRYDLKEEHSEVLPVTLEAGQHIFVRPRLYLSNHHLKGGEKLVIVSCVEALSLGAKTKVAKRTDIFSGESGGEAFPQRCP